MKRTPKPSPGPHAQAMKPVKPVPFRHRPKGLTILYEDSEIIVVDKAPGLLTVKANYEKENTAHQLLTTYVRRGSARSTKQVHVVHRLDRETSGVLVFAKSYEAKDHLKRHWRSATKRYLAVVHGVLKEKSGTITSYLAENDDYEVSSVADPEKGKLAITAYRVLKESDKFSLLEIELLTGKKNQIRVHLSEKGHPVVNDDKYGRKGKNGLLALHSHHLAFTHPVTGERTVFEAEVPAHLSAFFSGKRSREPEAGVKKEVRRQESEDRMEGTEKRGQNSGARRQDEKGSQNSGARRQNKRGKGREPE